MLYLGIDGIWFKEENIISGRKQKLPDMYGVSSNNCSSTGETILDGGKRLLSQEVSGLELHSQANLPVCPLEVFCLRNLHFQPSRVYMYCMSGFLIQLS